jgi:hypothetical protein
LMDYTSMVDWRVVARDFCRFLHETGGIYSPIVLPILEH